MGQLQQQVSSPNLETANKATVALTQNAIAADRMEAARPKAYASDDLSGYGQFKAGYTQGQDLRAFKVDLMAPAERASLMQDMKAKLGSTDPSTKAEAKKFWSSLQNAHNAGVLNAMPSGGAGGQ